MEETFHRGASTSGSFVSTNWSMVYRAGVRDSDEAQQALALLCGTYWYPLFSFARRNGHDPAQAEDLTQGFFEVLLEKEFLKDVDREYGRFRSFLLASFKHFIANRRRASRTQKRGGNRRFVPIDLTSAEERYTHEPFHQETPEQMFEHQWAVTLLEQVLTALRNEYEAGGKREVYESLRVFLDGSGEASYREIGEKLALNEGAVKVAVHRMRKRFGELLRQEISLTVANTEEVDDEVRQLFELFRSR